MFIVNENGIAQKIRKRRKRKYSEPEKFLTPPGLMVSAESGGFVRSMENFEYSIADYVRDYNELPPITIRRTKQ